MKTVICTAVGSHRLTETGGGGIYMHHLIISGCHRMLRESPLDAASICCCQKTH